jgi:hypothetical protein
VAQKEARLAVFKCTVKGSDMTALALAGRRHKVEVWHRRLGHLSYGTMARIKQDQATSSSVEGVRVQDRRSV